MAKATSGNAPLDRWTRRLALDLFIDPNGVRGLAEIWLLSVQDALVGRQATPVGSLACLVRHLAILDAKKRAQLPLCDLRLVGFHTPEPTFIISLFGREHTELALSPLALQQTGRWRTLRALAVLCQACGAAPPVPFLLYDQEGMRGELIMSEFQANQVLNELFDPRLILVHVAHLFVQTLLRFHPVGLPEELVLDARIEALQAAISVFFVADLSASARFAATLAQLRLIFADFYYEPIQLERKLAEQVAVLKRPMEKCGEFVIKQSLQRVLPTTHPRLVATPRLSSRVVAPRLEERDDRRPIVLPAIDYSDSMDLDKA
jgi:hypothetical protein